jgi:hypothetical protein
MNILKAAVCVAALLPFIAALIWLNVTHYRWWNSLTPEERQEIVDRDGVEVPSLWG